MGAGANKVARIMVPLDCMLDTRMGTLAKIDPERAAKVLNSGKYHTRISDIFEGFTEEEFLDAYAKRDVDTLALSTLTSMVEALKGMTKQLQQQIISRPYHDSVEVVINYWPYELDEETLDEIGISASHWLPTANSVKLVSISNEALTPQFIHSNYVAFVLYDYDNWWGHHVENFKKKIIPDVHLWAPRIFFTKPPSDEELEEIKRDKLPHPLDAMQMAAAVLVGIQLIDIQLYSLPDPHRQRM